MFLPLERRVNAHVPFATFGLAAVNTLAFFALTWTAGSVSGLQEHWVRFGYTPAKPALEAAVTHLFIHANWAHVVGNMLFLVFFGMNCERRLGTALFLGLYLLSGMGALALFVLFNRGAEIPLFGASGAVSGVTGMYLALFARREVEVMWFALVVAGTLRAPAWIFTVLWAGLEVVQAVVLNGTNYNVANWAHVGGFMVGLGGVAMLTRLFGFRGRPETAAPRPARSPQREQFRELSYIPAPEAARPATAASRTYALAARRFGPLPPAAAKVLADAGHAPGPCAGACLARGLSLEAAQALADRLAAAGTAAFLFSDRAMLNVPPLEPVTEAVVEGRTLKVTDELGRARLRDLASIYLLSAGRVRTPAGERTFVDLFTTGPWSDLRLSAADPAAAARALLAGVGKVPAADTFLALAREGGAGGEPFPDLAAYDEFNLWLLQVHASGLYRNPAD